MTRASLFALLVGAVVGGVSSPVSRAQGSGSEPLVVIVNAGLDSRHITLQQLASIYKGKVTRLGGRSLIPFNLEAGRAERATFDRVVLHMGTDDVAQFWIDQRVRGAGTPPRQVPVILMPRLVAAMSGAIGYVPESAVKGHVRIVARIRDGKLVMP